MFGKHRDAEAAAGAMIILWGLEQKVPQNILEHWKEMMRLDTNWGDVFIDTLNKNAPQVAELFIIN